MMIKIMIIITIIIMIMTIIIKIMMIIITRDTCYINIAILNFNESRCPCLS